MNERRRQAYLEAMGYDVWLIRPAAPACPALQIANAGKGDETILLVCDSREEHESPLARDLLRTLNGNCLWAWPHDEADRAEPTLEQLIQERLFTEVIVFGQRLAQTLSLHAGMHVVGSARVQPVTSLAELAVSPAARSELWRRVIKPRSH